MTTMTEYTPGNVYGFALSCNTTSLISSLTISSNRINWYTDQEGGHNALHIATMASTINIINILLDNGIDINSKNKFNTTALIMAADNGHLQCMELLLNRGADINSRDNHNHTALHHTAIYGYKECVIMLLSKGAAIDTNIDSYEPIVTNATDCRPLIDLARRLYHQ